MQKKVQNKSFGLFFCIYAKKVVPLRAIVVQKRQMAIKQHIKTTFRDNKKVAENYLFMTLLQVLNVCFYFIVYPFLIVRLGREGYGTYAFAWSVVCIAMAVVNFGFDLPGAKRVAQIMADGGDKKQLSELLSHVQTAKVFLELIVAAAYVVLLVAVPFLREHYVVFAIGFAQTLTCIIFPQWYFQGVQRMRFVTYIQVGCKLLSLPFIFWLLHTPNDVWLFMLISTSATVFGAAIAWLLIRFKDGVRMPLVRPSGLKPYYAEAFPFFLTNAMGIVKEQGVVLLTGAFLGMADVPIFDLANKIVTVPRILLLKLNDALYPKIVVQSTAREVKRIMKTEVLLGLLVVAIVAGVGKWLILWLGHGELPTAYPVSIILSTTVLFWMVGTAFINFVFVPTNNRYLVTANQVVALVSCLSIAAIWLWLSPSVYGVAAAIAISGLCEVVFCSIVTKKKQLLA